MTIACLKKYWHVWAHASAITRHSLTGLTTVLKNIYMRLLLKIIIKSFLRKATGRNDHDMINVGGQRTKIGGN